MKTTTMPLAMCCLLSFLLTADVAAQVEPPAILWTMQAGSVNSEALLAMTVSGSGSILCVGASWGGLYSPSSGELDACVVELDDEGEVLWTKQFGTPNEDVLRGICTAPGGGFYVVGSTDGNLFGPNLGKHDGVIFEMDHKGDIGWSRQVGTSELDYFDDVCTDASGAIYVLGSTTGNLVGTGAGNYDTVLLKFDGGGTEVWTRQFGTPWWDMCGGLALDPAGYVVVAGTANSVPSDGFIRKYTVDGGLVWARTFGVPLAWDNCQGVAIGPTGDVFVAGATTGDIGGTNAGNSDVLLERRNANGDVIWQRLLGTPEFEHAVSIRIDAQGQVLIAGQTTGELGAPNKKTDDVFVAAYDLDGQYRWLRQWGAKKRDLPRDMAIVGTGRVLVCGSTDGNLAAPNAGESDVFVSMLGPVACYADCDNNAYLTLFDFLCFQTAFALEEPYADCDGDGSFSVLDFSCFQTEFASCP